MITRDGLVAEYLFNGNADDTSGSGFDGIVTGATPCPDRFGTANHAYTFDGKDDYIIVSPPPRVRNDALTVSVWARCNTPKQGWWHDCIICGGGSTARRYQAAASAVGQLTHEDIDWLGIHATRLNGHLMRAIFHRQSHPSIVKNPNAPPQFREPILIAAGWKPGWSTDYDAVLLASGLGATTVINLSDVDYVYSADPRKDRNAKPVKRIDWKAFRKLVGSKWDPGLIAPFDPVASELAARIGLTVKIIRGRSVRDVEHAIAGEPFKGTIIGD